MNKVRFVKRFIHAAQGKRLRNQLAENPRKNVGAFITARTVNRYNIYIFMRTSISAVRADDIRPYTMWFCFLFS